VLAYIWIIGYQGTLTQQASAQQLQERIKIEAVEYGNGTLTVYVRNIGDIKVTIDTAYLLGPSGTVLASNTGIGKDLQPGELSGSGEVTLSYTLDPGTTYVVKVVTTKGTEATYTWTYRE